MKKLARFFILLSLVMVCSVSFVIYADTREGDELITNGDFDFQAGELVFQDPVLELNMDLQLGGDLYHGIQQL